MVVNNLAKSLLLARFENLEIERGVMARLRYKIACLFFWGGVWGPNFAAGISAQMIPSGEYASVEQQALEGSPDAAHRLAVQYEALMQYTETIFWGTIAAENGSQVGAYNVGFRLAHSPDAKQRLRGRYWLKKVAATGGDTGRLATSFLRELDEQERTGKKYPVVLPERYPKW